MVFRVLDWRDHDYHQNDDDARCILHIVVCGRALHGSGGGSFFEGLI